MKVYVIPADTFACGHYRMIWPATFLRGREDVDITIVAPGDDPELRAHHDRLTGAVVNATCPEDADVLVLQRPSYASIVGAIPFWRARGVAVVVDIDDDLAHIDPGNPAWALMHPEPRYEYESAEVHRQCEELGRLHRRSPLEIYAQWVAKRPPHSWTAITGACAAATMTTVSTPRLAQVYGKGNARVLYNYVPSAAINPAREDADWVGWAGSVFSHPGDLRAMGPSVAQLVRQGVTFRVVGQGEGADRELGVPDVEWTGPTPFEEWPSKVRTIGVGVAPLADTRFNSAKSWLKPLEYCAAGVPWVASPRVEYRRLAGMGAGVLAEKPKDWLRALRRLVDSPVLRAEQSEAGLALARSLTIEEHCWRWAEAWQDALALQRGLVSA